MLHIEAELYCMLGQVGGPLPWFLHSWDKTTEVLELPGKLCPNR